MLSKFHFHFVSPICNVNAIVLIALSLLTIDCFKNTHNIKKVHAHTFYFRNLFESNSTIIPIAVMKCLILAILFVAIISLVPAYAQIGPSLTGTCASIGYSTSCCPVNAPNCQATDGNCRCGSNCHTFGDCCSDVSCPSSKQYCNTHSVIV